MPEDVSIEELPTMYQPDQFDQQDTFSIEINGLHLKIHIILIQWGPNLSTVLPVYPYYHSCHVRNFSMFQGSTCPDIFENIYSLN